MNPIPSFRLRRQQGMALVESMVAVVLLGIGLVGAVAMQARAYQSLADAGSRAEATIAIEKLVGIMSTDQANLAGYNKTDTAAAPARLQNWYNETRAALPTAVVSVDVEAVSGTTRSVVTVGIAWKRQGIRNPGSVTCVTSGDLPSGCNRQVVTSYISGST